MRISENLLKSLLVATIIASTTFMISCSDDDDSRVIIENTAAFEYTLEADGSTVVFTNTSINASNYEWHFGDGTTSTEMNPVHSYIKAGTYTVILYVNTLGKVDQYEAEVTVTSDYGPLELITYEEDLDYPFISFGNAVSERVDNPVSGGINTSAKVGQFIKSAGAETWAGTIIYDGDPIDFSILKKITMNVYAPKIGAQVLFKVETADGAIFSEIQEPTTQENTWETLTFDLTEVDTNVEMAKIVVFFDFGVVGDGSTYYFDDILQAQ